MTDTVKKDDNILDQDTIMQIKKELTQKKEETMLELQKITNTAGSTKKNRVKFPEYGDKADENAQEIDEYTTNLATDKLLETTLRDVNAALERIEKGTYGICKYCKQPIGKKRMLARPVASTCVECKTKLQNSI